MAKRNKSKAKQRKKRQLRKRIFKVTRAIHAEIAPIPQPIPSTSLLLSTYKAENGDYQAVLDHLFDRKILVVDRYLNGNATIIHFCRECKNRFYARPAFLTSGMQPHVCFSQKSHPNNYSYGIPKSKKGNDITWDDFQALVWDDLTYQEIAKKLGVPSSLIKEFFISEGLISNRGN